jgi:serine/threonine-protein kinase HipA
VTATTVNVFLDDTGEPVPVGAAYVDTRRGTTTTTFEYRPDYLSQLHSWSVSPDLPMAYARATTDRLPGAMADSAPDRWGRRLIDKRNRALTPSGATPKTMTDVDYLLGASDVTRQGALRYTTGDDPTYLEQGATVPKLVSLPELLNASREVERDTDDAAAIKALLDAGSGSLGGARPKASVQDDGRLLIAKFPHASDDWMVMAWEKTALDLAERAGLRVPPRRLEPIGSDPVLIVERFDREGARRIPYISAMTMLGSTDGMENDYIELAEALGDHGSDVVADLDELWRRIAFTVAIHNTDDHMRNHGFVFAKNGWKLAPMFDVNPNPDVGAERVTGIGGSTAPADAYEALMDVADTFRMDPDAATEAWDQIRDAVSCWAKIARANGVSDAEIRLFEPALTRY